MALVMKRFWPLHYSRELFTFTKDEDGGTIALDWYPEIPQISDNKPIIAIMPGLSSDNDVIYIVNLVLDAHKNGFTAVVINYRGAS